MAMRGFAGPKGTAWGVFRALKLEDAVLGEKLPRGLYKRIWRFARPYRRGSTGYLVLVVVEALLGAVNPLLLREVIDRGILQGDSGVIIAVSLLLVVVALADAVVTLGERILGARISEGLAYDMRTRVYDHVARMPMGFFVRTQTGGLISRLNSDVAGAQQAFTNVMSSVVGNCVTVLVTLVAMFVLSWQITLLGLMLVPVFLFPARWVRGPLARLTRERYEVAAKMNHIMSERFDVSGALLMKLYGSDDNTFRDRANDMRDIIVKQSLYGGVFVVALVLVASLASAIVYGAGGMYVADGSLKVGTLVAVAAYLNRLYAPLTSLSNAQVDVMTALVSFDRVFEVLDLEPLVAQRDGAQELKRGPASVQFDQVDFSYPSADEVSLASLESVAVLARSESCEVLHGVSFRAEPGQLVALVGRSGSGKTTISQLVPRIYDVKGGAVCINGVDVRDVTTASLRELVGVVTQDAHMFHETIRHNLLFARPEATEADLLEALGTAQVRSLVESLPDGLDTVVGDRGYRLSGGEKQRIAIARLLLKAPDIVVLDEATAHLDTESERKVQQALAAVLTGRTSIVIAHRLSTVRNADLILVIDDGRVVERGCHDTLVTDGGLYAYLCETQFA
ncbi:MAG: ABC transporter ATP-binding protein [Acidimicrobiia bacterium]